MNDRIYHITERTAWEEAALSGVYRGNTLKTEGFIHCSTGKQVQGTANRFYFGRTDLVLLEIDPGGVIPEIRYENSPDGGLFPHVYGPIDVSSIVRVHEFQPGPDGKFIWFSD